MGIRNAVFVSFVSVHQADVILKAFSLHTQVLIFGPFPPIFGTSEAKNLGPAIYSLILIVARFFTALNFRVHSPCLNYIKK